MNHANFCFIMATQSLYAILDGWTLFWDSASIDITLNEIASAFYKQKVSFVLLDRVWDMLEYVDDPLEFMTDGEKMYYLEKLLSDEQFEEVARFVQIQVTNAPEHKISVMNAKETIAKFPSWFEEYEGITWDEYKSKLFDEEVK